jgi:hypothetical protein
VHVDAGAAAVDLAAAQFDQVERVFDGTPFFSVDVLSAHRAFIASGSMTAGLPIRACVCMVLVSFVTLAWGGSSSL